MSSSAAPKVKLMNSTEVLVEVEHSRKLVVLFYILLNLVDQIDNEVGNITIKETSTRELLPSKSISFDSLNVEVETEEIIEPNEHENEAFPDPPVSIIQQEIADFNKQQEERKREAEELKDFARIQEERARENLQAENAKLKREKAHQRLLKKLHMPM